MDGVPGDPRGDTALRPHDLYEPGFRMAQSAEDRAPEARGGTAAAVGFVLSLVVLAVVALFLATVLLVTA